MTTIPGRTVLTRELRPIVGNRFQPTGFPDLGAGLYQSPTSAGDDLAVESPQSMANHLEATTWNDASQQPAAEVADLPYVRVESPDGEFLTSSRVEAHRLAGAYLLDAALDGESFRKVLEAQLGLCKGQPLNMGKVYSEVFRLDPVSLLHGIFFAQKDWPWQPKIQRAVTAFVDASGATPAVTGGVKKDAVNNTADREASRTSTEGYGSVPFSRTEYVAQSITLSVVIDDQQIDSYGLSEEATELLKALACWEVASLLAGGLRLRTACDLADADDEKLPEEFTLDFAKKRLSKAVAAAHDELGDVTTVVWAETKKK